MREVTLTIDGQTVRVPPGATILEAASSLGIEIPQLCYLEGLSPFSGCRLCLVEVEGARTLVPACSHPVKEGIIVRTTSERVLHARRLVLELLLSDHPQDCLTCERNGACKLQDYAYQYGLSTIRFAGERHHYPLDERNPFIIIDYNKCILCGRCVRICEEVQGRAVLDFSYRGFATKVTTPFERPLTETNCEFCGQCVAVCPTGALTEKARRFKGREWELRKVTTVCPFCGVGCQLDLNIKDGKVVRVTSTQGAVNGRNLCVKGRFGFEFIHREDRLKRPLVRRGEGSVEVSWDEALDLVARRLTEIKERYGPDAIAGLSSAKCTNEENYLFQKFMRAAIGTNNVDHCARLCHAPTVAGLVRAFGSGAMTNSIAEIEEADCILVTGSNTTEAHPIIGLAIKKAVRKGAKLILVDPREIELAEIAHLHLRQRPGTDVAWLNGFANVILNGGLWDQKFVEERCEGFEEFKKAVEKYTPEFVEKITGIPADRLREAARTYARAEKATIIYSMGMTQHSTGTDNVLAIANLAMLTGQIGRESTGVNPLRGQNNVQGACDLGALPNVFPGYQAVSDPQIRRKFEEAWGVSLPSGPGLTVVEMIEAVIEGKVKAMVIMGENPMVSDPDIRHVEEALKKLEFLVVMDIFLSETAQLADVVLPAASFAEKDGTFTNTERRVQLVRRAVPPPGEAMPDWEILCGLAERMGYKMSYAHPREIMEEIASLAPIYGGIRYERLEGAGLQWPCPTPDHPGTKFLHKDRFTRGKGKFHAVEYRDPAELPDEEYPLILTTGRVLYHFHSRTMTARVPGLQEIVPEAYVELNPEDARALGIIDGERVRVSSRRGEIELKARLTERVPKGTVFIPFHFGEAAANVLTNPVLDPISKIPELKVCAVRVERAVSD